MPLSSRAPRASVVTLPKLAEPPGSLLDFLAQRFPRIEREVWRRRLVDGKVLDASDDKGLAVETPYRVGLRVRYFREVEQESKIPFSETILFRNDHLLVVDKPHFLPVVPAGSWVNECLLYRLQRATGITELTPVHRLDRLTAGLVLFSVDPQSRAAYHRLFTDRCVHKEYEAISHALRSPRSKEWLVQNRLERGEPWFRMAAAAGEVNAVTRVELADWCDGYAHFSLEPETGKQHQLRVHLSDLGYPIVGDPLYPTLQPKGPPDYCKPMLLLARRLRFRDPVSGEDMDFTSPTVLENPTLPGVGHVDL